MAVFGGGLGATGGTCGALIGSLAVLGLKFGRHEEKGHEGPEMWRPAMTFVKRFREEIVQNHGSIRCRDITKIDWLNRKQVKSYYKPDEKFLECARIIGDSAKLVGELLEARSGAPKEKATAEECVTKVKEAANLIQEVGLEAALKKINDNKGPFRWKDSYVFVFDDETAKILAHPFSPLIGRPMIRFEDDTGKQIYPEILQVAETKGEGWLSYAYRGTKKLYFLKVPAEKVIVAAGFYIGSQQALKP